MAKNKSKEQLSAENRALKSQVRGNSISKILSALIKWGAIAFVSTIIRDCISFLAGKVTFADIKVGADLFTIECKWAIALGLVLGLLGLFVGASGFIFGSLQLKIKKGVIESKDERITSLEARLDPKRSSSGLTPRGDTRKEDKE